MSEHSLLGDCSDLAIRTGPSAKCFPFGEPERAATQWPVDWGAQGPLSCSAAHHNCPPHSPSHGCLGAKRPVQTLWRPWKRPLTSGGEASHSMSDRAEQSHVEGVTGMQS